MDIPVEQPAAIEVSGVDPWEFCEDVAFDDYRYLFRWKVSGHFYADVRAFAVEEPADMEAGPIPDDETPAFQVTVKWDGCCDWRIATPDDSAEGGYLHTCSPEEVAALAGAMVYVQRHGLDMLEARADYFRMLGG